MPDGLTLLAIVITFFLAGAVKGIIGLGLPTVSLALLSVMMELPQAMALLLVPSFMTNLWQAVVGGSGKIILRQLWLFFLMATITVSVGAIVLTRVDVAWLSALLGALLVVYSLINLVGLRLTLTTRQQRWIGPILGSVNGILTGMTGSFVVPGVLYLQAIGLPRDRLIQAMGILFTASTVALAVALQRNDLLTIELGLLSTAALLPAMLGMLLGQRIRQFLSEQLFRRVFFIALLLLGVFIVVRVF